MTYCYHPLSFLSCFGCYSGADWAGLVSSSISPDVTGLSSSVCRLVKRFCNGTPCFRGSLFLLLLLAIASFNFSVFLALLPSVCASGGVFGSLAMGCGSTVDCVQSKSISAFLMLCSLLTASCSSATYCRRSSTCAHLLHAGLLPVPAPGKRSKHLLQCEHSRLLLQQLCLGKGFGHCCGGSCRCSRQSCSLCFLTKSTTVL